MQEEEEEILVVVVVGVRVGVVHCNNRCFAVKTCDTPRGDRGWEFEFFILE